MLTRNPFPYLQHCDLLRKAAEAGGLLVDAMVSIQDDLKDRSASVPPLMVVENGCGSPCIDLRQVSSELAAAAKDADLVGSSVYFCNFYVPILVVYYSLIALYHDADNFRRNGSSYSHEPQCPF